VIGEIASLAWAAHQPRRRESGGVRVEHSALRVFAAGAARRIRATTFVILAALRRISEAIAARKPDGAKKHDCTG
jgi:hypothetical protein